MSKLSERQIDVSLFSEKPSYSRLFHQWNLCGNMLSRFTYLGRGGVAHQALTEHFIANLVFDLHDGLLVQCLAGSASSTRLVSAVCGSTTFGFAGNIREGIRWCCMRNLFPALARIRSSSLAGCSEIIGC